MQLYLPIAEVSVNAFLILGLGGIVGFLSGMFGVGGGFLITPLLFFIGVPYAMLWAVLAGGLRFIPYVGPIVGAAAPILTALAVLEGWTRPFVVIGLFVGLEVFTNLVLASAGPR